MLRPRYFMPVSAVSLQHEKLYININSTLSTYLTYFAVRTCQITIVCRFHTWLPLKLLHSYHGLMGWKILSLIIGRMRASNTPVCKLHMVRFWYFSTHRSDRATRCNVHRWVWNLGWRYPPKVDSLPNFTPIGVGAGCDGASKNEILINFRI